MAKASLKRLSVLTLLGCSPFLMGSVDSHGNFDERILAAHNRERAALGVPALRWNSELAEGARSWAVHLAQSGKFEHSPDVANGPQVGENLWAGTRGAFQPESMVGLWIAEKRHFRSGVFPKNSNTGRAQDVGHYTQLIWRRSQEVGCAVVAGKEEEVLVCRYSSAGNVIGQAPV